MEKAYLKAETGYYDRDMFRDFFARGGLSYAAIKLLSEMACKMSVDNTVCLRREDTVGEYGPMSTNMFARAKAELIRKGLIVELVDMPVCNYMVNPDIFYRGIARLKRKAKQDFCDEVIKYRRKQEKKRPVKPKLVLVTE